MLLRLPVSPMPSSVPKLILDIYTLGLLEADYLSSFDPIDKELPIIEDQINKGVIATMHRRVLYTKGTIPW